MPRPRRGNQQRSKLCNGCKRPPAVCARAPCVPRLQQLSAYNVFAPFPYPPPHHAPPEENYTHPSTLHHFPSPYEVPMMAHPFPGPNFPRPISFQEFTEMQHHHLYNLEAIFQQHRNLLATLHERSELVGRVHIGVMQTCTIKGIIIDLIVYDHSGRGKIFGEREDRVSYADIVADPEYLFNGEQQKEFSRYVIKAAVVPWFNLPNSISSLPLMLRMQTTLQYIPPLSVFKVFCPSMDSETMQLSLKMANRSSPVIHLQPYINKELSFAKRIKKINGNQLGARPRFLVIIDFEATCDFAPEPLITVDNSEIIEFPWVVLDTYTLDIVYERRFYVRPSLLEGITNYCQNLTGITKDDCCAGLSLADAINEFDRFLQEHIFPYGESNFRIVTDSVWDLQVQLRLEAQRKGIPLAWWYQEYFDLRQEFRHFYAWFPFVKRGPPLHIMLNAFNLKFFGRHHSGLDDCKTIAQIVKILLQLHPSTFTNPIVIPPDYNPHEDPSWCSFMGVCPPEAWQCSNEQCQVWNKPNMKTCRFCKTTRT